MEDLTREQREEAAHALLSIVRSIGLPDPQTPAELESAGALVAGLLAEGLMNEEVEAAVGPHNKWGADGIRRNGYKPKRLSLFGRLVEVRVPIMRAAKAVMMPDAFRRFSGTAARDAMLDRQQAAGVSLRRHATLRFAPADGKPVRDGQGRSNVSEQNIARDRAQLEAMRAVPLGDRRVVAVLLDGIAIGRRTMVVAIGILANGEKVALDVSEGQSESHEVVLAMLERLVARGLDPRRVLWMTDGGSGLLKAIRIVAGEDALIQRCIAHKTRNVTDTKEGEKGKKKRSMSKEMAAEVTTRLHMAWRDPDYAQALGKLEELACWLEEQRHPKAAGAVRRQMADTLTCTRLGVTGRLLAQLNSTNAIESVMSTIRRHTSSPKRWTAGDMRQRWVARALAVAAQAWNPIEDTEGLEALEQALRTAKANEAEKAAAAVELEPAEVEPTA